MAGPVVISALTCGPVCKPSSPSSYFINKLDVHRDAELARRYGSLAPVLDLDGREACRDYPDLQVLRDA